MTKILAVCGSLREHAYSRRVMNIAVEGAIVAGAEVNVFDLRTHPMPAYNEDEHVANGMDKNEAAFQDALAAHDGFIFSSPEYNGSVPGGFKNAIDWASRKSDSFATNEVWNGKTAAIIASSPGSFGGLRCLSHLRGILTIMGLHVLPMEIAVSFVSQKFEGNDTAMTDEKMKAILEKLGASLVEKLG